MLRSRAWKRKYTLEDGDLIGLFYVPALQSARSVEGFGQPLSRVGCTALSLTQVQSVRLRRISRPRRKRLLHSAGFDWPR